MKAYEKLIGREKLYIMRNPDPVLAHTVTEANQGKEEKKEKETDQAKGEPKKETEDSGTERIDGPTVTKGELNVIKQIRNTDYSTCSLCFDKSANAVLMECGHGGICDKCGERLLKGGSKCHLCRAPVALVLIIDPDYKCEGFIKVIKSIDNESSRKNVRNSRFNRRNLNT